MDERDGGDGDPSRLTPDRKALVAKHLGLVGVHLRERVSGWAARGRSAALRDDLFQTGCLGLIEAAAHYNAARHGVFAAYALPRIRRAVHAALLAERSVVRVPYGAASRRGCQGPVRVEVVRLSRNDVLAVTGPCSAPALPEPGREVETIRHVIRGRFQGAARHTVERLAGAHRRPAEARARFSRVANERVLISDPARRTPVRQLARELGVAAGQVTLYEQRILAGIQVDFAADPQLRLLVQFARQDPAGFDGPVDDDRRRRLRNAELQAFEQRFAGLDRGQRAGLLYSLIERTSPSVPRLARELFALTLSLA